MNLNQNIVKQYNEHDNLVKSNDYMTMEILTFQHKCDSNEIKYTNNLNIINDLKYKITQYQNSQEQNKINDDIQIKINKISKNIQFKRNIINDNSNKIKNNKILCDELNKVNDNYFLLLDELKLKQLYFENYNNIKHNKQVNNNIVVLETLITDIKSSECEIFNTFTNQYKIYNNLLVEKQKIIKQIDILKDIIKKQTNDIDDYNLYVNNIKHNKNIQQNINKIDVIINNYKNKMDSINCQITVNTIKLGQQNTLHDIVFSLGEKQNNITEQLKIYKILYDITHINGLPLIILNKYLPNIQDRVNSMITPFIHIKTELLLKKDKIYVNFIKDDMITNIIGGMQSFIINIAFKIAMSEISVLPKCNILIIDEGISVLDKAHINKFSVITNFLKKYYDKIILISHIESITDFISNNIEIHKKDKHSYINNQLEIIQQNNTNKKTKTNKNNLYSVV